MSGSFAIESGQIVIRNGSRVVSTTDGTLVNLLPSAYDYAASVTVTYPDFQKDYVYRWWWQNDYNFTFETAQRANSCLTSISAVPQLFDDTTTLAAAPAGADFFAARVRINRTTAPSHGWVNNDTIVVLPIQNQWIPFFGSVLLEAGIGMARAMSIYIDGGNLVLRRQQSVSVAAGGFGTFGQTPSTSQSRSGGENVRGSADGIPVGPLRDTKGPTIDTASGFPDAALHVGSARQTNRRGQSDACVFTDNTNYTSVYQVEIQGAFGRRS